VVRRSITEEDKKAIRTIVISGLPDDLNSKTLWKKVRKYEGAESIKYPIENSPNSGTLLLSSNINIDFDLIIFHIAHAIFTTPAHAMKATEKLHAHTFKSSVLSVILKKRLDNLFKSKLQETATKTPSRSSRVIVRNLPWNVRSS
jgi:nucleolar protein 4